MNCMICGAALSDRNPEYCPQCGSNVILQRKIDYLSKYYYNQGLEKAVVRDLSGAIVCLKQSITYNKMNIQARNLLGLAYFETGEVVAALSEWVISKNLQPGKNLANEYIIRLQANANRLDAINDTIRKYNEALNLARQRHEDMAAIKLRKVLTQNPKLIKGYHLLALIQMKNGEWVKSRRVLKKALKIDKTNTTTLRFLREIDDHIGTARKTTPVKGGFFSKRKMSLANDDLFPEPGQHTVSSNIEAGGASFFLFLILGIGIGVLAFYLLAVPAIRQRIYQEANHQIVRYNESLSSQSVELSKALGEARESGDSATQLEMLLGVEKNRSSSYQHLFEAYLSVLKEDYDSAALEVQQVYENTLSDNMKAIYNMVCNQTGVRGITSSAGENDTIDGEETQSAAADENG